MRKRLRKRLPISGDEALSVNREQTLGWKIAILSPFELGCDNVEAAMKQAGGSSADLWRRHVSHVEAMPLGRRRPARRLRRSIELAWPQTAAIRSTGRTAARLQRELRLPQKQRQLLGVFAFRPRSCFEPAPER
jgi:hypothetical protein